MKDPKDYCDICGKKFKKGQEVIARFDKKCASYHLNSKDCGGKKNEKKD